MSIRTWFRLPRVRRGLAASVLVLAAGGLVLARTPASARSAFEPAAVVANGVNRATFKGPGAHGTFALSHTKILAGGERRLFAELDLKAEKAANDARERAPLSLAVVLDTSGSMGGEKMDQAKLSVIQLLREMRDSDEIAVVRYASDTELLQPLARVGDVRESLIAKVRAIEADGGTNIPPALSMGLAALEGVAKGRVRRVVLASDGLDSSRVMAEQIARSSAGRGVTVSSMGIGLDFDESYMGGVAQAGHGNFAFVKDGAALATFLRRELVETAATTIERATARVKLPPGTRFVRAIGADARMLEGGSELELSMGSLFAGDERRVVIELAASIDAGQVRGLEGKVSWNQIAGDTAEAPFAGLALAGTSDAQAVEEGRDADVYAHAMSATASLRQLEAAEAYGRGDGARAQALIDQNMAELGAAATAAPAAAPKLMAQAEEYEKTKRQFAGARPTSTEGRAAAKAAAAKDHSNVQRSAY